jgi:hypothetical protein
MYECEHQGYECRDHDVVPEDEAEMRYSRLKKKREISLFSVIYCRVKREERKIMRENSIMQLCSVPYAIR